MAAFGSVLLIEPLYDHNICLTKEPHAIKMLIKRMSHSILIVLTCLLLFFLPYTQDVPSVF